MREDRVHYQTPLCGLQNLYSKSPQDSQPLAWGNNSLFNQQPIIKGFF